MRLRDERVRDMKAEHWERVSVKGIQPYAIDRVTGTYTVEFDRRGRSLPLSEYSVVQVRAFDVRCPDGSTFRFPRLKDAKTFIVYESNGLVIPAGLMAAGRRV
jgi:hypothetical protein